MKYILPLVSLIILVVLIAAGAFYFGKKSATPNSSNSASPPPTVTQTENNTLKVTPILTPTPTREALKTVSGGGVLVFSAYTLSLPSGWASQKQTGQNMDTLTLAKDTYKIVISQAAGGGGGCTYPGEAQQEMAQTFSSFVEISNPNGFLLRRGPAQGSDGTWTVCEKRQGAFSFPTSFGYITITTPVTPTALIMAEVDSILASLNKK